MQELQFYLDWAARVVAASSFALLFIRFVAEPVLDIWAPREEFPRARRFADKVEQTVRVISVSPQRFREGK